MRPLVPLILALSACNSTVRGFHNEPIVSLQGISTKVDQRNAPGVFATRMNDINVIKLMKRGSPPKSLQIPGSKVQGKEPQRSSSQREKEVVKKNGREGSLHQPHSHPAGQSRKAEKPSTSSVRLQNIRTDQQQQTPIDQWDKHTKVNQQQISDLATRFKQHLPPDRQKHVSSLVSQYIKSKSSMMSQPGSPHPGNRSGSPQPQHSKESQAESLRPKSPTKQANIRLQSSVEPTLKSEKPKSNTRAVSDSPDNNIASSSRSSLIQIQSRHADLLIHKPLVPSAPFTTNQKVVSYGNAAYTKAAYKRWLAETQSRIDTLKKFPQTQTGQTPDQEDLKRQKEENTGFRTVADVHRKKFLQSLRDNEPLSEGMESDFNKAAVTGYDSLMADRNYVHQQALASRRASKEHRFNDAVKHEKTFARAQMRTQLRMTKHMMVEAGLKHKLASAERGPNSRLTIDASKQHQKRIKDQHETAAWQYQKTIDTFSGSDSEEEREYPRD